MPEFSVIRRDKMFIKLSTSQNIIFLISHTILKEKNMVFRNLGEEKAKQMFKDLIRKGMSSDDAFTEMYSLECSLD